MLFYNRRSTEFLLFYNLSWGNNDGFVQKDLPNLWEGKMFSLQYIISVVKKNALVAVYVYRKK